MIYQFGNLSLNTNLYQVLRDGEPITVEPQVFDLLIYLVENRDRVVSRNELLDTLWKGRIVSDSALNARLKATRKVVGDTGRAQEIIKTIHGRGYQFIAAITEFPESDLKNDAELSSSHPLPPTDKPSIAVLPFINLSNDPEQEYFSDGITEDIITALSRISGLLVIARNSTKVYKDSAVDIKRVGQEQGVRYVLAGSVRKAGERIRVTAQLSDATTGHDLWAEHYDHHLNNIFDVQDEITKQVTTELNVRLVHGEEARVWARGTTNIKAWERVVRAYPLADDHIKEHNVEAQRLAGEAVQIDPDYENAWVTLGWTHWEDALWSWGESNDFSMATALSCAQRALKINSENPDALALLGTIHLTNKDAKEAIELCKKAVALSPNHSGTVAMAGMAMICGGKPKDGLNLMKRAIRLCPMCPQWYLLMTGAAHHIIGDQGKAITIFRECVKEKPGSTVHKLWLTSALVETGYHEEIKKLVAEILEIDPDFTVSNWIDGFSADEHLTNLLLTNLGKAGLPVR